MKRPSGLRLDVYSATMLFHNDIVAHRKTQPRSFARWLRRKERVEHLFLHFGGNASAVVANADFYGVTKISCGRAEDWFEA